MMIAAFRITTRALLQTLSMIRLRETRDENGLAIIRLTTRQVQYSLVLIVFVGTSRLVQLFCAEHHRLQVFLYAYLRMYRVTFLPRFIDISLSIFHIPVEIKPINLQG